MGPGAPVELLERALAAYARRWPALCAIFALAAVPSVLLQAAIEPSLAQIIAAANAWFAAATGDAEVRARTLAALGSALAAAGGRTPVVLLAEFALYLIAQSAAFADLAHALDGRAQTVTASYRQATGRWFAQVIVGLSFVVLSWGLALVFVAAVAAGGLLAYALTQASRELGAVAGVVVALALGGGFVFVAALGYLAWLTASATVATEPGPPLAAVRAGLRRTLEPAARRRTFVLGPTLVAANWTWSLAVAALAGAAVALSHADALAFVFPALGAVVLDGLRSAVLAVYLRDVRLRSEGADLLLLAQAEPSVGPGGDDGLNDADHALIAAFLARRAALDPPAASALAAHIAGRMRPKLRASFHYLDDVELLEHLARSRG